MDFHVISRRATFIVLSLPFLLLAACGGGGGGGDNAGSSAGLSFAPSTLSFTPSPYEEMSAHQSITVNASGINETVFEVIILDRQGILDGSPSVSQTGPSTFQANFQSNPSLDPGRYRGNLEVNLCANSECSRFVSGSPFRLAYDVTIRSHTNLTPLAPIQGASEWHAKQGSIQNTGHLNATLDPANFTPRWIRRVAPNNDVVVNGISTVVSRGGVAYLGNFDEDISDHVLRAVSEQNGEQVWQQRINSFAFPEELPLAILSGQVIVQLPFGDRIKVYDSATGAFIREQLPFNESSPVPPFVADEQTVITLASDGRVEASRPQDGQIQWSVDEDSLASSNATADNDFVYTQLALDSNENSSEAGLHILNRTTGTTEAVIAAEVNSNIEAASIYRPILTDNGSVIVPSPLFGEGFTTEYELIAYELTTRTVKWRRPLSIGAGPQFTFQPAYANGLIYACSEQVPNCSVIRESDGVILRSFEAFPTSTPVISNNLMFFDTVAGVSAIDLTTGTTVWEHDITGPVSLSANGILYISSVDGVLAAINLQ